MAKEISQILDEVADYMNHSTQLAHSSKQKYLKAIRLFLIKNGSSFSMVDVNRFISESNNKNNCYNYRYGLAYLFKAQGRKDLCDNIVSVKKKPRKKVFTYIPKKSVQDIINHLPKPYKHIALIQYLTGVRYQEAATLRAENIDWHIHPQLIYIRIGVNMSKTKGSKERKIRLPKKYEPLLRSIIMKSHGYLFLKPEAEDYSEEQLAIYIETLRRYYDDKLNTIGKDYGIEAFSSHYLRHLYADEFMMAGGKIEDLKNVMGHEKIDTTLSYVSIGDAVADRVILKMHGGEENG